mgnify:CR=1 FL=1
MQLKHKNLFWILALLSAIIFDRLFWEQGVGLNVFLFIMLALLAALVPIWLEKLQLPWLSYLLLVPVGVFSFMIAARSEPFTTAANVLITLSALILLSLTLRSAAWKDFTILELIIHIAKFLLIEVVGGLFFFTKIKRKHLENEVNGDDDGQEEAVEQDLTKPKGFFKRAAPYLRGVLIALPVIIVLALLLAQADLLFNQRLQDFFAWIDPENFGELVTRLIIIFVIGYVLLSSIYIGLVESPKQLAKPPKPGKKRFSLGLIEAVIVLGSINILFISFVLLQFTYLFGGRANISAAGYTFAEYARRGFFELLAVAVISLLVFYFLSTLTKRETRTKRWFFSGLGLLLVVLVGVILASAYYRLSLYEAAYGFTRLRTLTHSFIIWTGLLLIAVAALEVLQKIDRLVLVLILFIIGYGITLNMLNIDSFIVRQNVSRALSPTEEGPETSLDAVYLSNLSADAITPLVDLFQDPTIPEPLHHEIGGVLACWAAPKDLSTSQPWFTMHFAKSQAFEQLESLSADLEAYDVFQDEGWFEGWFVTVNGETRGCFYDWTTID